MSHEFVCISSTTAVRLTVEPPRCVSATRSGYLQSPGASPAPTGVFHDVCPPVHGTFKLERHRSDTTAPPCHSAVSLPNTTTLDQVAFTLPAAAASLPSPPASGTRPCVLFFRLPLPPTSSGPMVHGSVREVDRPSSARTADTKAYPCLICHGLRPELYSLRTHPLCNECTPFGVAPTDYYDNTLNKLHATISKRSPISFFLPRRFPVYTSSACLFSSPPPPSSG